MNLSSAGVACTGLLLVGCAVSGFHSDEYGFRWGTPSRPADPVVDVAVGTSSAPFVIDTGTSEFLVTKAFAKAAGLAGDGLVKDRLVYTIGTREFVAERHVVIEAAPLEEAGWGGILSPQLFAGTAAVAVDFRRMKMTLIAPTPHGASPGDCAAMATTYFGDRHKGLHAHRLEWRGRRFGTILVAGALDGRKSILLDVDTGSPISAFHPSYIGPAAASGQIGPRLKNLSGNVRTTVLVPNQTLRIGGLVLEGRSVVAMESGGALPDGTAWEGRLGMDLLKDAVLLLCPKGEDAIYIGI
ncbi:MAG: hypothetical protein ACXW34_10480 [Nitrospira sp.]